MKKIIFILSLIVFFWLISPIFIQKLILPLLGYSSPTVAGIYTAVAALFSSLAFSILIFTLWLQKEQFELQKKELKLSKIESQRNIEISAYSALLTYYNNNNSYDPKACELTPMDIAKKLNEIIHISSSK